MSFDAVDPLVEIEQDTCGRCGAYTPNPQLHSDWHAALQFQVEEIRQLARRPNGMEVY